MIRAAGTLSYDRQANISVVSPYLAALMVRGFRLEHRGRSFEAALEIFERCFSVNRPLIETVEQSSARTFCGIGSRAIV